MVKASVMAAFFVSAFVFGTPYSEVIEQSEKGRLSVTQPATAWKKDDFVCVFFDSKVVACGVVVVSEEEVAEVDLDFSNQVVQKGWMVGPPPPKGTLQPSVVEGTGVKLRSQHGPRNLLRGGLFWDVSQWFFAASYNRLVSNHVAFGIQGEILDVIDSDKNLSGYGFLLTRSFFTQPRFAGIGAQIGVGPYVFSVSSNGLQATALSVAIEASISWRFQLLNGLSLGVNSGLRFVPAPSLPTGMSIGVYHPLKAAVGLDVGLSL
jgi:hypothetical protein